MTVFCFRAGETSVLVSLPSSWSSEACGRPRTRARPPAFTPDLEVVPSQGESGEATVWTINHQGCGERGLVVRASQDFFTGSEDMMSHSEDMMTHHKKGKISLSQPGFVSDRLGPAHRERRNNLIHLS